MLQAIDVHSSFPEENELEKGKKSLEFAIIWQNRWNSRKIYEMRGM
jgi:hypothetical protein